MTVSLSSQYSVEDSQYALCTLVAYRVAVLYVARAARAAAKAKAKLFDARYDAALRESELAHLVVGDNIEVRRRCNDPCCGGWKRDRPSAFASGARGGG